MPTTSKQREDFVRAVMSAVARAFPAARNETRALLAAWGALESGWGQTRQAQRAFNYWNVSKGSWTGPTMGGNDTEYAAGDTAPKPITQQWRIYASLDAAILDLLTLLGKSRFPNYREAFALLKAGDKDFVLSLGLFDRRNGVVVRVDDRQDAGSYYTLPRSEYQKSFIEVLADVRDIVQRLKLNVTC
jgi:hypothetical protein